MRRFVISLGAMLIAASCLRADPPVDPPVIAEICCQPEHCHQHSGFYGWGEALLWWIKDSPEPVPLVTTAPGPINAGSAVLMGGGDIDNEVRTGLRLTLGWLAAGEEWGIESTYLYAEHTVSQTVGSDFLGNPPLFIPFFNVVTNAEDRTRLSDPNPTVVPPITFPPFLGQAALVIYSELQGAEANLVFPRWTAGGARLTYLAGFRWLQLREVLEFNTSSPNVIDPPAFPVQRGSIFSTQDRFDCDNNFFGGQVGARLDWLFGRWSLQAAGKLALGCVHENVNISGYLATNTYFPLMVPPLPGFAVFPGGYFTQPTNIGTSTRDRFAVAPEVDINIGFQVTPAIRFYTGYTFLYLSEAARPGEQIDRRINPSQAPAITVPPNILVGPAFPARQVNGTDFWAHGINFGVEIRY